MYTQHAMWRPLTRNKLCKQTMEGLLVRLNSLILVETPAYFTVVVVGEYLVVNQFSCFFLGPSGPLGWVRKFSAPLKDITSFFACLVF